MARARQKPDPLTLGECRTMAAMMCDVDPDDVLGFCLITVRKDGSSVLSHTLDTRGHLAQMLLGQVNDLIDLGGLDDPAHEVDTA